MKGEIPFSSPCVVGHEITGEVVDHGTHTPIEIVNRYIDETRLHMLHIGLLLLRLTTLLLPHIEIC